MKQIDDMETIIEMAFHPFDGTDAYVVALASKAPTLDGGYRERIIGNVRNKSWRKVFSDEITSYSASLPHCINWTPALHSSPDTKKGSLMGSAMLWADFDALRFNEWYGKKWPKLMGTFLEPHFLVNSGWGTHLYWMLDEVFPLGDKEHINKFNRTAGILSWMLSSDPDSLGAEHLMRMPLSYNCKTAPFIKTEVLNTERTAISFDSFSGFLDSLSEKWLNEYEKSASREAKISAERLRGILSVSGGRHNSAYTDRTEAEYVFESGDSKKTAKIMEFIKAESKSCPFLAEIIGNIGFGWYMWLSLASAFGKVFDRNTALELFRAYSLPGNTSRDPEREIRQRLEYAVKNNTMPYGCSHTDKMPVCAACSKLKSGECRNVISAVRRAAKAFVQNGTN